MTDPRYLHARGTRANFNAKAAAGELLAGEVYIITDEGRLAAGTSTNSSFDVAKRSEITDGIQQTNAAGANVFEGTVDARNSLTISGTKEIGAAGDFTSILTAQDTDTSLTVDGLNLFTEHRGADFSGEVNVVDGGGILSTGVFAQTDVRVRQTNPEFAEFFGFSSRVARNFKDGTDVGNQNIWLTGGIFAVQQDSESTAGAEEANALVTIQKIENGTVGYSAAIKVQGQIGNGVGRDVTIGTLSQTLGSNSYLIGAAGNTTTITTFAQLDLPKPTYAGTVNITNHFGVRQMDDGATNVFKGPTDLDNDVAVTGGLTNNGLPVARVFAATVGDGSATSFNIDHNLGTLDVIVQVVRVSDGLTMFANDTRPTINRVTVSFAAAPSANQYRVLVLG